MVDVFNEHWNRITRALSLVRESAPTDNNDGGRDGAREEEIRLSESCLAGEVLALMRVEGGFLAQRWRFCRRRRLTACEDDGTACCCHALFATLAALAR